MATPLLSTVNVYIHVLESILLNDGDLGQGGVIWNKYGKFIEQYIVIKVDKELMTADLKCCTMIYKQSVH